MKKFALFLASALSISLNTLAARADECKPNLTGYDICAQLKSVQTEAAMSLPMHINKEMIISQIRAFGTTLTLSAV